MQRNEKHPEKHPENPADITQILDLARRDPKAAQASLLPVVYEELRALSKAVFSQGSHSHTLQPTALVHEAWMKLAGHLGSIDNRGHFFATAAKAMRQILADYARRVRSAKRGSGHASVTLHEGLAKGSREFDVVAFDDALSSLSDLNERHARVVELRVLGSLTIAETAEELGVSTTTVVNDWTVARAWLRRQLVG